MNEAGKEADIDQINFKLRPPHRRIRQFFQTLTRK